MHSNFPQIHKPLPSSMSKHLSDVPLPQAALPIPSRASVLSLFQLLNKLTRKAIPVAPIKIVRAALMPAMYATRVLGTWSAVNAARICVTPVATTAAGSSPGAVMGRVVISLLTKADCPAEMKEVPPTFWKTGEGAFQLVVCIRGGIRTYTR